MRKDNITTGFKNPTSFINATGGGIADQEEDS